MDRTADQHRHRRDQDPCQDRQSPREDSAKTDGVLDLTGERWRDRALASTEVGDIWGIGRQYAKKLNRNGVMTALDLTSRPDGWIRKEMGVGGLKTVQLRVRGLYRLR